jgi:hypothetical protein
MTYLFLFCAIVGGTILACQLVMTVMGVMDLDLDLGEDFGDSGDGSVSGHAPTASDWLFGVISFRTLVAAFTFFGLGGMMAHSAELHPIMQLLVASGAGLTAMYSVFWLMRAVAKLAQDGTVRIQRALGKTATVYLPIPASNAGAGKVQVVVQQRLMEYEAVTPHRERLPAGAIVTVTRIVGTDTLEVEPAEVPVEQSPQTMQSV